MIFFGNKSINGRYHLECRDSMAEPLGNWAEGKRNRGHFVILIIISILIIILIIVRIIAILIILKILIGMAIWKKMDRRTLHSQEQDSLPTGS